MSEVSQLLVNWDHLPAQQRMRFRSPCRPQPNAIIPGTKKTLTNTVWESP